MKKNTLLTLITFFTVCLFLFACRKDIANFVKGREVSTSIPLETAKLWRAQNLTSTYNVLKPHWDDAWQMETTNNESLFVVPANTPFESTDMEVKRFFFFTLNGTSVTNGQIVEIMGNNYDLNKNIDFILTNYDNNTIIDFNGAILQYDINYNFIKNSTFDKGKKNDNAITRFFTTKKEDLEEILSNPLKGILTSSTKQVSHNITGAKTATYDDSYAGIDTLSYTQISIRLGTNSTFNYTGQPISQNTLGTPNSITTADFEMINSIATIYNYSGAKVAYVDGEMYSYEITSSAWSIGATGGPYIKVGANISTLAALLPNYNSNKVDGTISATISNNGILTDSFLYIQFDPSTSIITEISLHDY